LFDLLGYAAATFQVSVDLGFDLLLRFRAQTMNTHHILQLTDSHPAANTADLKLLQNFPNVGMGGQYILNRLCA